MNEQLIRKVLELRSTGRPLKGIASELQIPYQTAIGISNGSHYKRVAPELPRFINGRPFFLSCQPEPPGDKKKKREAIVIHVLNNLDLPWREIAETCPVHVSTEYCRKIALGQMHANLAVHLPRLIGVRAGAACERCRFVTDDPSNPCDLGMPRPSARNCGSYYPNEEQ
jgi:hypothetical protein